MNVEEVVSAVVTTVTHVAARLAGERLLSAAATDTQVLPAESVTVNEPDATVLPETLATRTVPTETADVNGSAPVVETFAVEAYVATTCVGAETGIGNPHPQFPSANWLGVFELPNSLHLGEPCISAPVVASWAV